VAAVVVEFNTMTAAEMFSTHSEPAWRDRADFIINAKLPEEGRWEQLWARKVSDETFELCCIPFFLYDIALGDVVQTSDLEGRKFVFARVLKPSGRYVFRAHFGHSSHPRDEIVERLTELGAGTEWSSATLLAIDAVDLPHAQQVADFLNERSDLGQLLYETGRTV
jgi:hypothetical protein